MSTYRTVPYRPGEALLALYRRRGAFIDAGVGRHGFVYLLGPKANRFVFANADAFSWRETFESLVPVDGPTALIVSDGEDHRRRRSIVAPGLRHRSVQDYVATMVSTIDNVIDSWRPGQPLDIYQEFRCAVRRSTTESLFGPRVASHSDYLGRQLQPLIDLTHRLPQVMQLQQRLNSPGWRRAMAARTRIDELIDAEIANARAEPSPDDRMLTALINGRSEEGCALSDNEIRDSIVSLIAAGYETTSGALAWATYTLLTLPGAWETAAREVARVLGGTAPSAETLGALTYLNPQWRCARNASALLTGSGLGAPADPRPLVRRAPDQLGTAADLQRIRNPSNPRSMAESHAVSPAALGPRRTGLPQARAS